MIMVLMFLILSSCFSGIGLIRRKLWKELMVFGLLTALGLFLCLIVVFGGSLPFIGTAMTAFIKRLFPKVFVL